MSRSAIEEALQAFVVAATGLGDSRVIFSEQNGVAPASDGQAAVTIAVGDALIQGVDAVDIAFVDTVARTVTQEARGQRELTITFRGYSPDVTGDATAAALLEKLPLQAAFDDARGALNDAGLGLNQLGTVQSLPRIVNAGWESQAILEWRCCVLVTAQQTVPYIAQVNGTGTIADADGTPLPPVPFSATLP